MNPEPLNSTGQEVLVLHQLLIHSWLCSVWKINKSPKAESKTTAIMKSLGVCHGFQKKKGFEPFPDSMDSVAAKPT